MSHITSHLFNLSGNLETYIFIVIIALGVKIGNCMGLNNDVNEDPVESSVVDDDNSILRIID